MKPAFELPHFDLLEKLGTGGTAQVYKFTDTSTNNQYALKTCLDSENINPDDFLLLARREFQLTHNIKYPGIVSLHGIKKEKPYHIILEYCPGRTMEQLGKFETIPEALNILSSIAINLEYLRLSGITHADLKPDNIFLPKDESIFASDRLFYTKLSDFSLGQFDFEEPSERAGMGTIGFMAPEVIDSNQVSFQSDYFALGVIAYQLLSGQHPFITDDADPIVISGRIKEETPADIHGLRPEVPEKLHELIFRLLDKKPKNRPSNGWEICQKLREAGATYPFEKALNPKYLVQADRPFEENVAAIDCNARQKKLLSVFSENNQRQLRNILAYNFIKKNLFYSDNSFVFQQQPLYPVRFLDRSLKVFLAGTYTEKKRLVEEAIQTYSLFTSNFLHETTENTILPVHCYLPHLLSSKTVKRTAYKLGKQAETENDYYTAANLHVMAGDLSKAENSAYQAAVALKKENKIFFAIELIDRVLEFATVQDKLFETASLLMLKGDYLKDSGETIRAEAVYFELIEVYKNRPDDLLLAEAYKDLGDLYKMKQLPDKGIEALEKALLIYQSLGNELEISHTYNNLCNIYIVKHDYKQAINYARKALFLQRKLQVDQEIASTLNNLAVIYSNVKRIDRSAKLLHISYEIKKSIGDKAEIALAMNNLGYCYYIMGDNVKAVTIIQEALVINKELGTKQRILHNLENLTTFMFQAGHVKESLKYLREAIPLAIEIDDPFHIGIFHLSLGSVLYRMGKIQEAVTAFEKVKEVLGQIKDYYLESLFLIERSKLSFYLNQRNGALELIGNAKKVAELSGDQHVVSQVSMMTAQLKPEPMTNSDVLQIDPDTFSREEKIRFLYAVNSLYKEKNIVLHDIVQSKIESVIGTMKEDIEYSNALVLFAEILIEVDNKSKASEIISNAKQTAQTRNLQFDFLNSIIIEGRLVFENKEYETCFALYKQALQIAKNIADQLSSDADKSIFQQKKEIIFLVSEIKKLASIIGKKKEQVV